MKHYIIIPLISAFLAAAASWMVVRSQAQPAAMELTDPVNDEAWLVRELGLSEEQQQKLSVISNSYRTNMANCISLHCAARCQIGSLMFQPGTTEADLEAVMEKYSRAMLDAERTTLRYFQAVHALLTPEQQAKYTPMMQQCICGTKSDSSACHQTE
jgi:Spy/CpxP family protein refolding chaperone